MSKISKFSLQNKRNKYPKDLWVDGKIYRIVKEVDFTCTTPSMVSYLYNLCRKYEHIDTVDIRVDYKKGVIEFQYITLTDN
mgnify:CR=1 FL=1